MQPVDIYYNELDFYKTQNNELHLKIINLEREILRLQTIIDCKKKIKRKDMVKIVCYAIMHHDRQSDIMTYIVNEVLKLANGE